MTHPIYSRGRREENIRIDKENMVNKMAKMFLMMKMARKYIFKDSPLIQDGNKVYFRGLSFTTW